MTLVKFQKRDLVGLKLHGIFRGWCHEEIFNLKFLVLLIFLFTTHLFL